MTYDSVFIILAGLAGTFILLGTAAIIVFASPAPKPKRRACASCYWSAPGTHTEGGGWFCHNPDICDFDLIRGTVPRRCHSLRSETGKCGPEGRHFRANVARLHL